MGYHKLNTLQLMLEEIMEESEMARHSVKHAELLVWMKQNPYAADVIKDIWLNLGFNGMSEPESIGRCWRKIRENHPEYCDSDRERFLRKQAEEEFRRYSHG